MAFVTKILDTRARRTTLMFECRECLKTALIPVSPAV